MSGRVSVNWFGPEWLRKPMQRMRFPLYDRVTKLHLIGSAFDDADLLEILAFRRLERLSLMGTGVSPEGIARLRAALPRCRIETDPKIAGIPLRQAPAQIVPLTGREAVGKVD